MTKIRFSFISLIVAFVMQAYTTCPGADQVPPMQLVSVSTACAPIAVCAMPGDTTRLFVVDRSDSKIKAINRVTGVATVYLAPQDVWSENEVGVLGMAFHPQFAANGYLYVNVSTTGSRTTEIRRYQAIGSPSTSSSADPASRTLILSEPAINSYHRAGWLEFGLDGYLYGAIGEDGISSNAQDLTNLRGKIFRIDLDHPNAGRLYGIPNSNPFAGHSTYRKEILHYGLRNPWRCSIDRANGDLWIGDVGDFTREEIDYAAADSAGLNFGWPAREGMIAAPAYSGGALAGPVSDPIYDFERVTAACIIGGIVYRGSSLAELQGRYLCGDWGGPFFILTNQGSTPARATSVNASTALRATYPVSFGVDELGEIYLCHQGGLSAVRPPTLTFVGPNPLPAGTINTSYLAQLQASGGAHPLRWSSTGNPLPTGLSLSTTGEISGVMASNAISTNCEFTVTDANGQTATSRQPIIARQFPRVDLETGTVLMYTTGEPIIIRGVVSNGVGIIRASSITGNAPPDFTVSFQPQMHANSEFTISCTGPSITNMTTTVILEDQRSPIIPLTLIIQMTAMPAATKNQSYLLPIPVYRPGVPNQIICLSALPSGMNYDPTGGILSGTPAEAGTWRISVGDLSQTMRSLVLTVSEPTPVPPIPPPTPEPGKGPISSGKSGGCGMGNSLGSLVALGLLMWLRQKHPGNKKLPRTRDRA